MNFASTDGFVDWEVDRNSNSCFAPHRKQSTFVSRALVTSLSAAEQEDRRLLQELLHWESSRHDSQIHHAEDKGRGVSQFVDSYRLLNSVRSGLTTRLRLAFRRYFRGEEVGSAIGGDVEPTVRQAIREETSHGATSPTVELTESYVKHVRRRLLFHFDSTLGNGFEIMAGGDDTSKQRIYGHPLRFFMLSERQYTAFETHLSEPYCVSAYRAFVLAQHMLTTRNRENELEFDVTGVSEAAIPGWLASSLKGMGSIEQEPAPFFDPFAHLRGNLWRVRLRRFWDAAKRRRREEQGQTGLLSMVATSGNADEESSPSSLSDSDDGVPTDAWLRILRRRQFDKRGGDTVRSNLTLNTDSNQETTRRGAMLQRRKNYLQRRLESITSFNNTAKLRKPPHVVRLNGNRLHSFPPTVPAGEVEEEGTLAALERELAAFELEMERDNTSDNASQNSMRVPDEAISDIDSEEEMRAVVEAHFRSAAKQSHNPLLDPPLASLELSTHSPRNPTVLGSRSASVESGMAVNRLNIAGEASGGRGATTSRRLLREADTSVAVLTERCRRMESQHIPPRFRINFPLPTPFTPAFRYLHFGVGPTTVSFLNSGSYGAPPIAVLRARTLWETKEHRSVAQFRGAGLGELAKAADATTQAGHSLAIALRRVQSKVALLLHTNPADLVFVTNCNTATSIVFKSLPWEPASYFEGPAPRFANAADAMNLLRRQTAHNIAVRDTPKTAAPKGRVYIPEEDTDDDLNSGGELLRLFDFFTAKELRESMVRVWDEHKAEDLVTDDGPRVLGGRAASSSLLNEEPEPPTGDSILLFSCDYEATFKQAAFLARERGVQVTVLEVEPPVASEVVLETIESYLLTQCHIPDALCARAVAAGKMRPELARLIALRRKRHEGSGCSPLRRLPRLINFSHVTSKTGWVFDAQAITALCHAYELLVSVDGAQAAGAFDVDIPRIGADFYTGTCHKWMFACPGVAFLAVAPRYQPLIHPLSPQCCPPPVLAGPHHQERARSSFATRFTLSPQRYDLATFLSVEQAFEFVEEVCGGWEAVWSGGEKLAREAADYLTGLWGVRPFALRDNRVSAATSPNLRFGSGSLKMKKQAGPQYQSSWLPSLLSPEYTSPSTQTGSPGAFPFISYQPLSSSLPLSRLPLVPLPHSYGCTPSDAVKVMGFLLSRGLTAFVVCVERDQAGVFEGAREPRSRSLRSKRASEKRRLLPSAPLASVALDAPMVVKFDDEEDEVLSEDFFSLNSDHQSEPLVVDERQPSSEFDIIEEGDPFAPGLSFLAIRLSCSPVVSRDDIVRLGAVVAELRGNYGAVTILKEYLPSNA